MNPQLSIKELINSTFSILKRNKLYITITFFLITIIEIILVIIGGVLVFLTNLVDNFWMRIVMISYITMMMVFSINIQIGFMRAFLSLVDGKRVPYINLLKNFDKVIPYIGLAIIQTAILIGGFLLLIIPGIYFLIRIYFSYIAFIDPKLNIKFWKAISYSWKLTSKKLLFMLSLLGLLIVFFIMFMFVNMGLALVVNFLNAMDYGLLALMVKIITVVLYIVVQVFLPLFLTIAVMILYRNLQSSKVSQAPQNASPQVNYQSETSDLKVIPSSPTSQ